MQYVRQMRRGTSGDDVMTMKRKLLALGYYADHITTLTRETFGLDTEEAVRRFQTQAGLTVDGVVGMETWNALFGAEEGEAPAPAKPAAKAEPSAKALMLCSFALTRLGDIYVWSESGCADLSDGRIRAKDPGESARAIRFRDAQYRAGLTDLLSHDCSGFVSYCLRQIDAWDGRRDCDGLWRYCSEIRRNELISGDFLFRQESGNPSNKTHIGLYIGSGKAVHCKGRDAGVVLEGINTGGSGYWHVCGRCGLLYPEAAHKDAAASAALPTPITETGGMDRNSAPGIV